MAYISNIAICPGSHAISQEGFARHIAKASRLSERETLWLEKLYASSQIETRYSVLEDFASHPIWQNGPPTTHTRNEAYKEYAKILSKKVAEESLLGHDPKSITHIICVSCTGIIAPGLQCFLQQELELSSTICQFAVTMMGCFGAFKALEMASAFCCQQKEAKVLIVSTELCSLHFQQSACQEHQVGAALFADAAASCIVSHKTGPYRMHRHKSQTIPNTLEKMTWEIGDTGLLFGIKKEVPDLIKKHAAEFARKLLPENAEIEDCLWPVHPGGKGILQAVEASLNLASDATKSSWEVLRKYGNVSSASFLFVLHEMAQNKTKKWAIGLGFGPGLSFEGVLLELL